MKMEALIPAPAEGEVRSVIKFLNALQKLRRVIQNKGRGMLSVGIVFQHDNARPHTVRRTASLLQEFSWEVFNHPPYRPDLAPSDFHLFLHFKKFHQRFENDREAEMVVTQWFQSQAADFHDTGIQKLVPRYDKCINCNKYFHEIVFCFCKRPQGTLLTG
jgi:histone-lysine N-methyltransferase SETMAR